MKSQIKVYLLLLLVALSLAVIFLHYKCFQNSGGILVLGEKLNCSHVNEERSSAERVTFQPLPGDNTDVKVCRTSPSSLMEQVRRNIIQTARYQRSFLYNQLRALQEIITSDLSKTSQNSLSKKYEDTLKYIMDYGKEYSSVIELDAKQLATLDGWDEWRKKEDSELRKIVRERLMKLQNPRNCSEAPVLVCNLDNRSGFSSGVHDVLWCFINAYKSQRRLVLDTSHWHYAPGGWETLFQPLSETCQNDTEKLPKESPWPGDNSTDARWLLRTIPRDLGSRIIRLYDDPLVWWHGQFLSYLMRPNDQLYSFINTTLESMNFSKGVAGIHVRRTDKISIEATAHPLEEYMEQVEGYFQSLELVSSENFKRRVYIATDEPSVLSECHTKYPQYECLYYPESAQMASNISTRVSQQSLLHLITDIFALSQADFIVCTMSSGVCRVVYELKMSIEENSVDTSDKLSSLDVLHHYAYVKPAARKAIYNHKSKSLKEISFLTGDVLFYESATAALRAAREGMLYGFVKMMNKMQSEEWHVPIYKTREMLQMINFTLN